MKKNTLIQRDLYLRQIEEEMRHKKGLLIKKNKELEEKCKNNPYLYEVKENCKKYVETFINEKNELLTSLKLLERHVDQLITGNEMDIKDKIKAKHDKNEIIKAINKTKAEINELNSI